MSLPATPNLDALVSADSAAVASAAAAIAAGAAASAKLTALRSQLDAIVALQSQYTDEMNDGVNRLADAKTAAGALATGPYAATVAAITAAAPGGLNNTPWKAVVSASMTFTGVSTTTGLSASVTGSYLDLATIKSGADTALVGKQATAVARGNDADAARAQLDAALAALTAFIAGVEADLASAQRYFDSAKVQVAARNFAGAWWSWFLAAQLVTKIAAADDAALMTALNTAIEKYAKAVSDLNTANGDVVDALALQSRAAFNLGIADNKVRATLATTAPV